MKYFLCRFLPPGPDFLKTMTPEQKVLMKSHGEFLQDRLRDRVGLDRKRRFEN